MQFLRKRLILLIAVVFIYGAFFFTHLPHVVHQDVLGATNNVSLFQQPAAGKDPILSAINSATSEVDVEVYLLSDKDVIASLVSACERGVKVRVMLEEHPFGGGNNVRVQQLLQQTCVMTEWTNPSFTLTHEKTILIDHNEVFILNQNLTTAAFTSNREYDILDSNKDDVTEIGNIFNADWTRSQVTLSDAHLLVSPTTSRDQLMSLISHATKEVDIETEVIDDPDIIHLVEQKAKTIPIEIILPSFSSVSANKKVAQKLAASGIQVKTISSPYIHAKLILADSTIAYVGSVNLTTQSMDNNREVGILLSQQDIVQQLSQDFMSDWQIGLLQ